MTEPLEEEIFERGENLGVDGVVYPAKDANNGAGVITRAEQYVQGKIGVHLHIGWKRDRTVSGAGIEENQAPNVCALFYRPRESGAELRSGGHARSEDFDAKVGPSRIGQDDVPVLVYVRQVAQDSEGVEIAGIPSVVRLQSLDFCLSKRREKGHPALLSFFLGGVVPAERVVANGELQLSGPVGGSLPGMLTGEGVRDIVERTPHAVNNVADHHAPVRVHGPQLRDVRVVSSCFRVELDGEMTWCTLTKNPDGFIESIEMFTCPL